MEDVLWRMLITVRRTVKTSYYIDYNYFMECISGNTFSPTKHRRETRIKNDDS